MKVAQDVLVIDTDTHVIEPPDLWTSRMSSAKWGDRIPTVRHDEAAGEDAWFLNGKKIRPAGTAAHAGWSEYPPSYPPRLEDADPSTWDAAKRLERMDADGIHAQLLYPNIAMFYMGNL